MVDAKSRDILDKLAAATDHARLRLKELDMPEQLEALDARKSSSLPEAVRIEIEGIVAIGGVGHLKDILSEVGRDVGHVLKVYDRWRGIY